MLNPPLFEICVLTSKQAVLTIERGSQQISALSKLCLHNLFLYNSSSHTLEGSISLHGLDFSLQETDGEICFVRFQASYPVTTSHLPLNLTAVAQRSKDDPNRIKVQGESERATSHFHNALLLSRSNIEVRDIFFTHKFSDLTLTSGSKRSMERCVRCQSIALH